VAYCYRWSSVVY